MVARHTVPTGRDMSFGTSDVGTTSEAGASLPWLNHLLRSSELIETCASSLELDLNAQIDCGVRYGIWISEPSQILRCGTVLSPRPLQKPGYLLSKSFLASSSL